MAAQIRRQINHYFQRDPEERHPYVIEFAPEEDRVGGGRQLTVQRSNAITGDFLMQMYLGILHSQEVIGIEGFRVFLFFCFLKKKNRFR
jgi:hypothetical protein